jgi:two-component system, cell cycle sensor histidine kinase and response regulator CckA
MKKPLRVLLVEDLEDDAKLLIRELTRGGYDVSFRRVETADALRDALARERWDAVLSDYSLPTFNGVAALRVTQESGQDLPFIFVSGTIGEDIAVGAMKAGAHDYVMKNNLARLVPAVERELRDAMDRQQHRAAETQMRMSEHKYRHLFRSMSDAALLVAMDSGKLIDANEQAEVLFGLPRERLLGLCVSDVYPEGLDVPRENGAAEGASAAVEMECVVSRPNGSMVPVNVCVSDVDLYERRFKLALFRDISQRKRSEAALRASEERLAKIFNLSPTAICIVRASDNRFVEANTAFVYGTGYTREEIIGHTPEELQLWVDQGERAEILREVDRSGTAVAYKLRGRRKNGETGVGLSSVTRINLNNGEPHFLWLIQDITEIDRADEARRESERRFRQLAENIDEVFWLAELDKRQLVYVSPAYSCVWGRSCESAYDDPLSWLESVRTEDRDRVRAALEKQATGDYDIEYRIVRPDGSMRWIHERAFPVKNSAGKIYRVAGIASDITVRRELEEQFRQAQKMEAVGQLAGGIAHDFNNLLTVIQLQASLLSDRVRRDREADLGVRQIMEAAKRASNLTRQLLTFSRRQTQNARNVDLAEVIGSMTKMLRRILGEDVCFESHFSPTLPLVYADPGMIEQVLMNLVVNARDAMPSGGKLTVSLGSAEIDAQYVASNPSASLGRHVCLAVSDTGTGIPPEIRSRIFEPFFTTKEVGKGTGLGLATVFGIVNQHRGWIELESDVGVGTTFRVYLPAIAQARADAASEQQQAPVRGGTETVLLVEDEDLVRALASTALRERGYRVLEATNVADALRRWDEVQGRVDLVLTDLIMPGGASGKDLSDQLLKRSPSLRIIFTTGHSTSAAGQALQLTAGVNYLEKPYSFTELATIVRRRLDRLPAAAGSAT